MTAYYNEIDPRAAAWLRELIRRDIIAKGEVDERSIKDVTAADLRGFTQCHFFAGIGVWSYALRRAGWSDARPVWTGSCPCQPFSAAGAAAGFDDERHLWPDLYRLARECRPDTLFGEQVASKAGLAWFDLVSADMEREGYAVGAVDLSAAGVGAPHIRQRLFWVADAMRPRRQESATDGSGSREAERNRFAIADGGGADRMGDAEGGRCGIIGDATFARRGGHADGSGDLSRGLGDPVGARLEGLPGNGDVGDESGRLGTVEARPARSTDESGRMADAGPDGRGERGAARLHDNGQSGDDDARRGENGGLAAADGRDAGTERESVCGKHGLESEDRRVVEVDDDGRTGPTHGFWGAADWLFCTDGKWRPVEPGSFPLAYGAPARVGRLRGYGNAINASAATAFIEAFEEVKAGVGE
jgi:DNA (cytosine-5)-methyltransferase 1